MGLRDRVKRRAKGAIRMVLGNDRSPPPKVFVAKPLNGKAAYQPAAGEWAPEVQPAAATPDAEMQKGEDRVDEDAALETAPVAAKAATTAESGDIREGVIEAIKTVYDPEIPVNIYELGLIYDVSVNESSEVSIRMTLTSPNCPAAQSLPAEVKEKSCAVDGAVSAAVEVVWDPPWGPELMSEAAQLELNLM